MLPRSNGVKKGISTIAAIAVVCVVGIAGGVAYLYPSIIGEKTNTLRSGTIQSQVSNITIYTTTTYMPPANATSTSSTGQPGWQAWAVANATLGYYKTQAYVRNAWNYSFSISQTSSPSYETFVSNEIFVLSLVVSGNWTTGYMLTYSVSALNVTVRYNPPSGYYPVVFFNAQNSSGPHGSVLFNTTQQKAISIALSNGVVKQDLSHFPYFVDDAFVVPSANSTFGGDSLVWFFQTNGPKIVGAYVNMSTGAVVSTYTASRVLRTCYSNGVCFSSPWIYS